MTVSAPALSLPSSELHSFAVDVLLNSLPVQVCLTDVHLNVISLNTAAINGLIPLERYLSTTVTALLGSPASILAPDFQFENPLFNQLHHFPQSIYSQLGPEQLCWNVNVIVDHHQNHCGFIFTWESITQQEKEKEKDRESKINLQSNFSKISSYLNNLFKTIDDLDGRSSDLLARSAEATREAESTSHSATNVYHGFETISGAVRDISNNIHEISHHANQAVSMVNDAVFMVKETDVIVKHLEESGESIGQFTRLLTSIASQTRMLALNATIEAARVGSAGKGFAVVAHEVKELANSTSQSAAEISGQTTMIYSDVKNAEQAVGKIMQVIEKISESQRQIAYSVEQQTNMTSEIHRHTEDSVSNLRHINTSVEALAKTVHDIQGYVTYLVEKVKFSNHNLQELLDQTNQVIQEHAHDKKDLIVWSDNLSVGVAVIDEQHQKLVSMINQLYRGMLKGNKAEQINPLLQELVAYTQYHFEAEEDLMRRCGYAELDAHLVQHHKLTEQVTDFARKLSAGEAEIDYSLLKFLRNWLNNHILREDKKYSHVMARLNRPGV